MADLTVSANVDTFMGAADYAAMRTQLGLVIGTNVQAQDAELSAIAGLTSAADKGIMFSGSGTAVVIDLLDSLKFTFDGGGLVIPAASKARLRVPFDCTIIGAELVADQSGSAVLDVWKDTYANYPPTVADTITAAAKPTLSTEIKSTDSTLTGWTTTLARGDYLFVNVDSASTVTYLHLNLIVRRRSA